VILAGVRQVLEGLPEDWRFHLAIALATALDEAPNASMARELRSVMGEIEKAIPPEVSSVSDDLRARRAKRVARAAS